MILASLLGLGCSYSYLTSQRDVAPLGPTVTWSGYVFENPDAAEEDVLVDGAIAVLGLEEPLELTQTYPDDYPGYWGGDVPPSTDVTLRITGAGLRPAVWAARTPGGDGLWFAGALFGMDAAWFAELLASLGLTDTGGVAVWGYPADPDAWSCAEVRVQGRAVSCFAVHEEGGVSAVRDGPFTWFFATGLDAGEVPVESGLGAAHTYVADDGDLVLPFWFVGVP